MNTIIQLNAAIDYIEKNLCADLDLRTAARLACVNTDSFVRFFSFMTGMTLNDYIRRRRLTLAAQDLERGNESIMTIALKYGYESAASFSRAFAKQHGLTPSSYRKNSGSLKIYPPISFHIMVKGAMEMDMRIIRIPNMNLLGIAKPVDEQLYRTHEELRHAMWASDCENVPGLLCEGQWNDPDSTSYDGDWYGIWQNGAYMIARRQEDTQGATLEAFTLPAGTYAAFKTGRGGLAWVEFPRLFQLIFDAWLPSSQYRQASDLIIEVQHLWTDHVKRRSNRYYEVWIPVEPK